MMHLPDPFSLIASCPRIYQRHPKMLVPGPSDGHFALLLQRVFDQHSSRFDKGNPALSNWNRSELVRGVVHLAPVIMG